MKKLSIIIVHYQVADLLRNCLHSIEEYLQNIDYEVIVIDNCSPDASWKNLISEFPKVVFISSTCNDGFAKANNKAVHIAQGEYILLLNPDTEIEGAYFEEILNFADAQKKMGCLGLRMHDAKGNFLPESKRSVPNLINSFEKLFLPFFSRKSKKKNYYRNDISETEIAEIEVITGAFLLIKKQVYLEVGGLDERYFMYGEDVDLCYTLLRKSYKNFYYGKYAILHYKGESTVKDEIYLKRFYGAMQIFLDKYYKQQNPLKYYILKKGLELKYRWALRKTTNDLNI